MFYYVSDDPDALGAKVQSTDPASAVAAALEQGRVKGSAWTVRWDLRPDNANFLFARVTTVTDDPRGPGAAKEAAAKDEQEAKARAEAAEMAKAAKAAQAEADKKAAADKKAKEEADKKAKEEADKKAKEEADKKAEANKKAKEDAPKK